uniref:Small ribosomal subunit protein bS20c n=1 Tax=Ishige okamurae TaxID=233772 RepID=A0A8E6D4U5_9PHAE|nr:ribosomal protein S20 [Ishige okamurae]QVJ99586.1 ribosomal protein S20 [Ishige okamurae]
MANNKSAKKRIKITRRNRAQNISYKSIIKTSIKHYQNKLKIYSEEPNLQNYLLSKEYLKKVFSNIDKATKRNVLHKNNASRKKSKLSSLLKKEHTD